MTRVGKVILVVGVVVPLSVMVAFCIELTRLHHTCVVCRLAMIETSVMEMGSPSTRYEETDCSRWYAAHVEPNHEHVWERGTCQFTTNLLGMPRRVSCRPGHYPIILLSPTTQMRAYQQFDDPLEAKRLFAGLLDELTYEDRLDEHDENRGFLTVAAISAWEAAGFPGTWDVWWSRYYAKHVEEHNAWLAWMGSGSGVGYREWQRQQAARED